MKTEPHTGWRARLPCVSDHKHKLSAYLDGELDLPTRAGVERHLADCQHCSAECERQRLASRAVSHFVVPEVRIPDWRAKTPAARRHLHSPTAMMRRLWATRVSVPAPVAAAACLAILASVPFLLLRMPRPERTPAFPTAPEAASPQIKIVEVPVERVVVVRERVVTRTRSSYGNERTPGTRFRGGLVAGGAYRTGIGPDGSPAAQRVTENQEKPAVIADLAEFTPATNAQLRAVREPER